MWVTLVSTQGVCISQYHGEVGSHSLAQDGMGYRSAATLNHFLIPPLTPALTLANQWCCGDNLDSADFVGRTTLCLPT